MKYRRLGKTGVEVPVVVFGAWAVGGWNWGGSDDEEAVRAIQAGVDAGMTAVDTAPVYGFGRSEEVVGKAIVGRRERVVLMTKVGLRWDDVRGVKYFDTVGNAGEKLEVYFNSKAWSVVEEVERSLVRMKTEWIDLVQVHRRDPSTPVGETMGALAGLVKAGKVRAVGVSNFDVKDLEEAKSALGDVVLASDQPKYSLVAREAERDVLPWCERNGVGTLVYSPLEQGLLTGRVDAQRNFPATDGRHKRSTFTPENRKRVNEVLEKVVRPIAERKRKTVAQVVIAWTVAQPGVTCALVGARSEAQARENAGAGEVELGAEELAAIRTAFEQLKLAGVAGIAPGWKRLARKILGR